MSDYISREAAIEDFEQCNRKNPTWTPQRVKTLLMRIQTADVEPVVHGRKIEDGDIGVFGCALCAANGCRKVRTIAPAAALEWTVNRNERNYILRCLCRLRHQKAPLQAWSEAGKQSAG